MNRRRPKWLLCDTPGIVSHCKKHLGNPIFFSFSNITECDNL